MFKSVHESFKKWLLKKGKAYFIHGNPGRHPTITLPLDTNKLILYLYRTKYHDCNLTHYSELLAEKEIKVSVRTISAMLRKEYIPKAISMKAVKKELKSLQSNTKSKKKAVR